MDPSAAIRLAVDLVQVPSRIRQARTEPLPDGIEALLRIASGDAEAVEAACEQTGRRPELLHEAATFFVEQILMAPGADSYRVLGAEPGAPVAELRRNMALLVRWLHPDVATDEARAVFAQRVNLAWEDLKTPERRVGYDLVLDAGRDPPRRTGKPAVIRPRAAPRREAAKRGGGNAARRLLRLFRLAP